MSEEDKELEQLKRKRLVEMQKNISFKKKEEQIASAKKDKPSPREILLKHLGYRGLEVLQNAEYQFPRETKLVVDKLGDLIYSGDIDEQIDGGQLLALFRSVGINVRMETKINVEEDGKFISLSDKFSKSSTNEQ
jgi:DNA-binding TFAR19-related protein (PDSD5 family)